MKQTTLFDFNLEKIKSKELDIKSDKNNHYELQKVVYKPSKLDSDFIAGFNSSLTDWIYPTNYPVREYQLQIVNQCLYKNTLVCLPTGLGKTFIATVVMYNFYRWYPNKKIVFVAPTRPLVRQQMLSASDCVPIDNDDVVEMTGSIAQSDRLSLWSKKRVFFLTAQVFVNDLQSNACPINDIIMVVMDEAHKATGNHAYCQIVRVLSGGNRLFRVLGLSATPGNDIETIQSVIHNLLISHIELRTDECKDIKMYSHERLVQEIVVLLGGEVSQCRDRLYAVCEPMIERLKAAGAIRPNQTVQSASKFGLLTQKEEYKQLKGKMVSYLTLCDFAALISLYHALELVQQHGLRPLYQFLTKTMIENSTMPHIAELMRNNNFMDIFGDLERKFQKSDIFVGGHPKLEKLKEIVKNHFEKYQTNNEAGDSICHTRVMVFSQFRDSVDEILCLLNQLRPRVRPIAFVGQKHKGTQKEQMSAMRDFIAGTANVLVSTCIGEEGLDVGEVDLIVCFDAQGSPIRLVQRLGRTGRKREGRIVMLLSEGKEVSSYRSSVSKKSRIHSAIFEGYKHLSFYPDNPRLVPIGFEPSVVFQKYNLVKKTIPTKVVKSHRTVKTGVVHCSQLPKVDFEKDSVDHMRFLGEERQNDVTFTQRYNVNRHKKSLYQSQKTFRINHSSLTEGVITILKLKEMHCRGKTNMIFHLSNSRNIDIDEPITQDGDSARSQHSMDSFSVSLSLENSENELEYKIRRPLPQEDFEDIMSNMGGIECVEMERKIGVIEKKLEEIEANEEEKDGIEWKEMDWMENEAEMLIEMEGKIGAIEKKPEEIEANAEEKDGIDWKEIDWMENEAEMEGKETEHIEENQGNGSDGNMSEFSFSPKLSPKKKITLPESIEVDSDLFDFSSMMEDWSDSNNISETPKKLLTSINSDRKRSLLRSFKLTDTSMKKQSLPFIPISAASFVGRTSTPIRSGNRKSLLDSFHNTKKEDFGLDTALEFLDKSANLKYELSTDLFGDDKDISVEESNEEVSSTKKRDHISALLNSFRLTTPHKTNEMKTANVEYKLNKVLDSDEDLFADEDLLSDNEEDESQRFSPLSRNSENNAESDESESFLQIGKHKSPRLVPNSSQETQLSDRSHSPSFDTMSSNDDVNKDLDFLGQRSPQLSVNLTMKRRKKDCAVKDFFLSQANVSGYDDDSDGSDLDVLEASFIDDGMTQTGNDTQMQQVYIRSLRTPLSAHHNQRPGIANRNVVIVDTQEQSEEEYECDSFLVPDNFVSPARKKARVKKDGNQPLAAKRFKRLEVFEDSFRQ